VNPGGGIGVVIHVGRNVLLNARGDVAAVRFLKRAGYFFDIDSTGQDLPPS